MRDSRGLVEQSALQETSEHFVSLPASLDEELPENSNQQNKSHPKTKCWEALKNTGKGLDSNPSSPAHYLGALSMSLNLSTIRQESTSIPSLAWDGCERMYEKAFCKQ